MITWREYRVTNHRFYRSVLDTILMEPPVGFSPSEGHLDEATDLILKELGIEPAEMIWLRTSSPEPTELELS